MKYKIYRLDGIHDDITSNVFDNYDNAYDLLESIYSDSYSQSHIKAQFPYLITVIQNKTKEKQLRPRKTKRF